MDPYNGGQVPKKNAHKTTHNLEAAPTNSRQTPHHPILLLIQSRFSSQLCHVYPTCWQLSPEGRAQKQQTACVSSLSWLSAPGILQ